MRCGRVKMATPNHRERWLSLPLAIIFLVVSAITLEHTDPAWWAVILWCAGWTLVFAGVGWIFMKIGWLK